MRIHALACLGLLATVFGLELPESNHLRLQHPSPPPQLLYETYHEFQGSPFTNYSEFLREPINDTTGVTIGQIDSINKALRPVLESLTHENFFKIYRLNLFKECPFWDGEGFCMHRSCAVDTIDDWEDLPLIWQPEALGKLESTAHERDHIPNVDLDDETCIDAISTNDNYCEIDEDDCVYVNLVDNPERFTGYGGEQSLQIWKAIYNENCFQFGHSQCVEKQFFYKVISGMHSSISTHLTNEFLDLDTKEYGPNLKQFMVKVGDFPDRLQNMYFNYILIAKALLKLDQFHVLDDFTLCQDPELAQKESALKDDIRSLVAPFHDQFGSDSYARLFDERQLFQDDTISLKDEFKERFRNVSRIMDCVHCDRCRLWGKVQTTGYGTAMKILFELDGADNSSFTLQKTELIALINTFDRLSKSISAVGRFQDLYSTEIVRENIDLQATPKTQNIFKQELKNVYDALLFVMKAYMQIPRMGYNWLLIRTIYYWNKLIGVVREDFDESRLYHIDL
ncbi:unnamed protein product [Kuraishia capsulata CBS 1993]|uniref:Endoplasmic reticulum oxidoreductin-1 n=1 Tax=Kuraishia capsulata CBS 1993 TaxID=1382522 RepID=W6MQH4_9ASCO|nr:uncharacterized protein KUCA_T00004927001 [Kuraishia capsulata CBS 1993]CDK28941.1 unnamed protein product [Kuraishia capsulata CBS 1993]